MRRLVVAALLALAACKQPGAATSGPSEAAAEVLQGSASDAMIPYDSLRSQPPLAPTAPEVLRTGEGGAQGAGTAPSDTPPGAADAEPPAALPAAAPD